MKFFKMQFRKIIFSATGLSQKIFKDTGREYDFSKILFTFQKGINASVPYPYTDGRAGSCKRDTGTRQIFYSNYSADRFF
jgi:hypothetical protein